MGFYRDRFGYAPELFLIREAVAGTRWLCRSILASRACRGGAQALRDGIAQALRDAIGSGTVIRA